MLQIGICDDDKSFVSKLEMYIEQIALRMLLQCNTDAFYDGSTLKEYIAQGHRYDIIFLDIEMERINGIEVAKYIRDIDDVVLLIYISNYDSYIYELFQVEPFWFIKKPVDEKELETIFSRAYKKISEKCGYYSYRYNKMDYKVLVKDILYMESRGRTISIIMKDGETRKYYGKLDEAEKALSKGKIPFLRIHQSYLVNFIQIKGISYTKVVINKGVELQISEERQRQIRASYLDILKGEMYE